MREGDAPLLVEPLIRDAAISEDGRYRYALERRWQTELPVQVGRGAGVLDAVCLFVMLNPSTADHQVDDPTVTRCVGFARSWGYTALAVCNLFAFRASDPAELYRADDPVGPDNDEWLRVYADRAALVVVAWGTRGGHLGRDAAVLDLLERAHGKTIYCLGRTRSGQPSHPLYLTAGLVPEKFTRA